MRRIENFIMQRSWSVFHPEGPLVRASLRALALVPGICLVMLVFGHESRSVFAATDNMNSPSLIVEPSKLHIIVRPPSRESQQDPIPLMQLVRRSTWADFAEVPASADAIHVADWVVDSRDNGHRPFVIVDKMAAKVFVFDVKGQLLGAAPALLGLAVGDHSVPGIGKRKLATIRPDERTTPAGRFVASMDLDIHGQEVLWVDYETAISMHRVVTSNPAERRLQRLISLNVQEHRISYGCINVPVVFFDTVLRPAFAGTDGIVYVLPDTRSIREVFNSYDVRP